MTKLVRDKYSYIIGLLLILIVTCGIVLFEIKTDTTVHMGGEFETEYTTVDKLKQDSDLILEVTATNGNPLEYEGLVFTLTDANVKKVYKGDPGKNVLILESGGSFEGREYVFEENPVLKNNESAIVFLKKYVGPITDNAYVVTGAIQGKFKIDGGKLKTPDHAPGELANVKEIKDLKLN